MLWVAIYGWFFWTLTPTYMLDANWIGMPGTPGQPYAAHLYGLTGQRFIPREMLALTIGGAASLTVWFLLAKAHQGPRNVILAIAAMIAVTSQFRPPSLMTVMLTAILVFPLGTFFIGCAFTGYAIYKLYQSGDHQYLSEAAFGMFALLIAVRVLAGVVPYGYSIYCATALFLVFVIALSRCIKAATPALSVDRQRKLVNYLLAAEVVLLALLCVPQTTERSARLETSWGEIYLTPTDASAAREMIDFISEQKRNGRKVTVLPEAPMLYALTGTEAPNRWYTLLPGYLSSDGEDAYIADLNRAAPDYILLTARNSIEYGASYFGIDYDQKIYHWIESNYRIAGKFGRFNRGEHNRVFAALLYQRRDPSKTVRTPE
jgi:hypothetical protein